jgi:peptide subunit release factor 1 (eRF1)
MLTLNDIHTLASRPKRAETSVLTVYLDLDQSKQANLNRGFETQLKDMLAGVKERINDENEFSAFERARKRIGTFVEQYGVGALGLSLAFDASDGFFWSQELKFPVVNQARWDREVFVEPIAAALDEYERVGIVLLDRANLRLFTMCMGELQEHVRQAFDHRKVRHTKTVGMNNLGAASHAQRKADEEVRVNLRQMIKRVKHTITEFGVHRIILAGSPQNTAQLRALLPKHLASRVIGTVDLAINATPEVVRNAAAALAENFEGQTEQVLVTDLITCAAKAGNVVNGLADTLDALNQGRVWQLLYAESFHAPGHECVECDALFPPEMNSCSFCGSTLHPIESVVERAVDHAIGKGLKVEVIRGKIAESDLMKAGGIGGMLRSRTASARVS